MRLIPKGLPEQIAFFESHLSGWAGDPAAVGLSESDVSGLAEKLDAAKSARQAAGAARAEAESATVLYHAGVEELRDLGSTLIQKIKAFARSSPEPVAVFTAANIPPARSAGPRQRPPDPTNVAATINEWGVLTLTWECSAAPSAPESRGGHVQYAVYRMTNADRPGHGGWVLLGLAGEKRFVDDHLPAGATQYRIVAHRGTLTSAGSAGLLVRVGTGCGGMLGLAA